MGTSVCAEISLKMVFKSTVYKWGWQIFKHFAKQKSFIVFKRAKYISLNTQSFLAKCFIIFYPHSRKMLLQLFVDFLTVPVSSGDQ